MKLVDKSLIFQIYVLVKYLNCFLLFIISLLLIGCANISMPEGGPIDQTTPEIIATYPDNNTINFNGQYLKFKFYRYVDELSFKESIFISPSVGELEFDWSGSEVIITFTGKLKPNTTYVVNIGTDVRDRFINQKQMAKAYTLAFSTGAKIDRGGIEGEVLPMKSGDAVNGIMIFAFLLDQINTDTLNPATSPPDFITQTGKGGDFFLRHIPLGNYRLFAIRDEYRNLTYDQEIDEYAVQSKPIQLTEKDTLVSGILLKLAKEDTTKPRLTNVTPINRNCLVAEFSESIDTSTVLLPSFIVKDTANNENLNIVACYPMLPGKKNVTLITFDQDSTKAYRMIVNNVKDSVGNVISPIANSKIFNGASKVDTSSPKLISISIKDSSQNIPLKSSLILTFSDAMQKTESLNWINILNEKKENIPCRKNWINDILVKIEPLKELESKTWYTIKAELKGLKNWANRDCRDSTKILRFETIDIEDFSSIEGVVIDTCKIDTIGKIMVMAIRVDEKNVNPFIAEADNSGRFIFLQVAEGHYKLQAFRDRNNNGKYDFGKPFPFEYSERLSPATEVFKIRARWPLEGLVVRMN